MRYYCSTNIDEYTLKSAYHTVKEGCDSHEDPRRPENRNPLGEVAVKLLPSTSSSMTLLDNRSPLTSNHLESPRRRDLCSSISCSLEPLSTARLFPGTAYSRLALLQRGSESAPKNAAAHHPPAPARITVPLTNARHDPQNGRARG